MVIDRSWLARQEHYTYEDKIRAGVLMDLTENLVVGKDVQLWGVSLSKGDTGDWYINDTAD